MPGAVNNASHRAAGWPARRLVLAGASHGYIHTVALSGVIQMPAGFEGRRGLFTCVSRAMAGGSGAGGASRLHMAFPTAGLCPLTSKTPSRRAGRRFPQGPGQGSGGTRGEQQNSVWNGDGDPRRTRVTPKSNPSRAAVYDGRVMPPPLGSLVPTSSWRELTKSCRGGRLPSTPSPAASAE